MFRSVDRRGVGGLGGRRPGRLRRPLRRARRAPQRSRRGDEPTLLDERRPHVRLPGTRRRKVRRLLLVRLLVEHVLRRLQIRSQQARPQVPPERRIPGTQL